MKHNSKKGRHLSVSGQPQHEVERREVNRKRTASRKKRRHGGLRVVLVIVLLAVIAAVIFFFVSRPASPTPMVEVSEMYLPAGQTEAPAATEEAKPSNTPDTAVPELEPTPEPTPAGPPVVLPQYEEDAEKNPDMFGWIEIEGTVIDYPVMYTPDDPEKYLYKGFEGWPNVSGSLFIDGKCSPDSDNLIIYGHNMKNGSMFHSIIEYENVEYFDAHPLIRFDTIYEEQEFEVMSAFYDRVYYRSEDVFKFYQFIDAEDEEHFDSAVQTLIDKSIYETGVTAEYGDQLIMLVTCAYHTDNGRFVVVARKSDHPGLS